MWEEGAGMKAEEERARRGRRGSSWYGLWEEAGGGWLSVACHGGDRLAVAFGAEVST